MRAARSSDVEFPKSLKTEKAAKKAWGHKCNMLYTFKFGGRAEVLTSTLKEHKKEEPKKDEKKDSGKVKIEPDHGKQKEKEKHEAGKTHKRDPKSKKDDKKKKKDVPHTWIATVNCTGSEDITPWVSH